MVSPHHFPHWYPTAAYLYVLRLDALALAWEYLRRHPDYRLDWLHRHRRPQAAQHAAHRWGLRLLEDPALDARDAHPAWLPGHAGVVQLYPDADPPQNATAFAFWRIPGHKQLIHDGKRLVLIAPYLGYMRQDRAFAPGEAVSQKVIGKLLASVFDALVSRQGARAEAIMREHANATLRYAEVFGAISHGERVKVISRGE